MQSNYQCQLGCEFSPTGCNVSPYLSLNTKKKRRTTQCNDGHIVELVSKELNQFGVIADSFRQIGGHSSRFVLFCSF